MKILVLTSLYTATRNIIDEDFGRQTRLFSALQKLGHNIDFFCADYRKFNNRNVKLHGLNVMIRPFGIFHLCKFLRNLDKNRGKYFIICTGHQAEENSIMDRIVRGDSSFKFKSGDHVIFSSSVIPVPINILAREKLDGKLRKMGVKIQTDVHVHGHGSREDMRDLLEMTKPEHVIPAHGTLQQETPFIELASEYGYKFGETSHLSTDGKVLKF